MNRFTGNYHLKNICKLALSIICIPGVTYAGEDRKALPQSGSFEERVAQSLKKMQKAAIDAAQEQDPISRKRHYNIPTAGTQLLVASATTRPPTLRYKNAYGAALQIETNVPLDKLVPVPSSPVMQGFDDFVKAPIPAREKQDNVEIEAHRNARPQSDSVEERVTECLKRIHKTGIKAANRRLQEQDSLR